MTKRRNVDPGGTKQTHPTRSFEQLVADATQAKLSGFITSQIQIAAQNIMRRQDSTMRLLFERITCLEEILTETIPGLTNDALVARLAVIQDRAEGFEEVIDSGAIEKNDRVRVTVETKTTDQTEYQGSSKLLIDGTGSGRTLGSEIEAALIGMTKDQVKEITFGKDQSLAARLTVSRISRQISEEEPTQPAPTEGVQDVSPNAG